MCIPPTQYEIIRIYVMVVVVGNEYEKRSSSERSRYSVEEVIRCVGRLCIMFV